MRVSIVKSGMSFSEWDIDVPALPRPGDHIQMWSCKDDEKTLNFTVKSVMFGGERKGDGEGMSRLGILIHCDQTHV